MISITAISSIVTILTIVTFIFIIKRENFDFSTGATISSTEKLNLQLIQEIYTELRTETLDDLNLNEYEADYELLEGKFELLEEKEKENEEEFEGLGSNPLEREINKAKAEAESESFLNREIEIEESVDLVIEATHNLKNSGQHRPYTLSVHFSPRSKIPWNQCKLMIEWPLPRNVFIDVWALRRLSPFTVEHLSDQNGVYALFPFWSVKPRHPDLEVGAYDQRARPFILIAEIPFKEQDQSPTIRLGKLLDSSAPWNLNVHVPDLVVRYQKAQVGGLFEQHRNKKTFLPAPELAFRCHMSDSQSDDDFKIDWNTHKLRPLAVSIPIGSANPLVAHITLGSVIFCSLALIVSLIKF